jgi:nicotinamidase-related amidase
MPTTLLIIDAQKDFHPGGSLAIPTADEDSARIASLIGKHTNKIDRIICSLDTHQKLHIAHPCFWTEVATGTHPSPFTIISAEDLRQGKYTPHPSLRLPATLDETLDPEIFPGREKVLKDDGKTLDLVKYCIEYAERLEAKGRFQICVWPEHCLIGSSGHGLVSPILDAIAAWSAETGGSVEWVWKGQNLLTEMYSAMEADVPVTKETSMNTALQKSIETSDQLIVCGQAMSHCVNYTLRDIIQHWPKDRISKITLLTDGASAVPGFEAAAEQFQADMRAAGVQLKTTADVF